VPSRWIVPPHRPLAQLADELWHLDADLDVLPIGRRMSVVRLASGHLVVHNAIACDAATMTAIDELGPVKWIVVPSGYHRMDAAAFADRYPAARVVTTTASANRVAKRCRVDGTLSDLPTDARLRWQPLAGVPAEAVMIHTDDAGRETLIFNDALMNLPARLPGFKGFLVKLIGSTGGPKVTRTAKFFIVKDRRAYATQLRALAERPQLARVVVAHGDILADGAAAALVRAADGLARRELPKPA
jgi:uncharacterized protein DUF4336